MLKVENVETYGWEAAIRGMRNPMNSWEKSDSEYGCEIVKGSHEYCRECDDAFHKGNFTICSAGIKPELVLGPNDSNLMMSLAKGGPVHAKFRRMLTITMDVTAPLYWWKEFDTYKVGTVANSCSTMHKIADKPFELDDFSHEHLITKEDISDKSGWIAINNLIVYEDPDYINVTLEDDVYYDDGPDDNVTMTWPVQLLKITIEGLNKYRQLYLETKDKRYWWQLIQLLPSSYNQRRTVQLNYEVAHNIYISRKDHRLDEWHTLCDELAKLPMSELITCE